MERMDLLLPQFQTVDLLKLTTGLSKKDLDNWIERELINPPHIFGRRAFSGAVVIGLQAMADLVNLGIQPASAKPLADRVIEHAVYLHSVYPAQEIDGRLEWRIAGDRPDLYHHAVVRKEGDKHELMIFGPHDDFNAVRPFLPNVYIKIEIDFLILGMLNGIYAHLAGVALPRAPYLRGPDVEKLSEAERADLIRTLASLNPPRKGDDDV